MANKVLTTVVSVRDRISIGDVGSRAISIPADSMPIVERPSGVSVASMQEEHIVFRTDEKTTLTVGDKLILLPWYQDMMINRWDNYIAVRGGVVEAVWPISGRGCFH